MESNNFIYTSVRHYDGNFYNKVEEESGDRASRQKLGTVGRIRQISHRNTGWKSIRRKK